MSKAPPELTWQDKSILVVIPVVVFVIFILANYVSKDLTVADAFEQKLSKVQVRDAGTIAELLPDLRTGSQTSQLCRLRSRDGLHEFTFQFNAQATETMKLEIGRMVQFYGEFKCDPKGGVIEVPFKGKSGRMSGWAVYENHRYYSHEEDKGGDL
ncbi:MAG: DUF3465 domain-containing protein [Candidatus Ozemobacteraceae bacterium]